MSSCCVKWCEKNSRTSNYTTDGITFHRFPKCPIRKKKWIDATHRGETWYPRNTSVLCSRHFTPDNFHEMNQRRRLLDSAVPTLYLPILTSDMGVNHTIPVPALARHDRDHDANTSASQTPILSDIKVLVPDRHAYDLDASTSAKQVCDLTLQGIKPTAGAQVQQSLDTSTCEKMVHNSIMQDPIPSTSQQQCSLLYLDASTSAKQDYDLNLQGIPATARAQVQQSLDMSTCAKMVHNSIMQDPIPSTSQQQCSLLKTPTRKRKLELDSPSAYDSPVKKRFCRRIIELNNLVKEKNDKLRKLRDANRKLKRQIISLKSLLNELEKKELITPETSLMLDSLGVKCREIIQRQLLKKKSGKKTTKKYSPQLRAFALTLNFYSTKAYNYVRNTFDTCLPSVKTIGKWYRSVDGKPGFTKEAFEALKIKSDQSTTPLNVCIVFDEMKIGADIDKSYGYVDFGEEIDSDCREQCTEALVFLVVPFHGKWKVPIGYFMVNKISADQKVFLLTKAVEYCNEVNIIVKAVTFDGCPVNMAMAKRLGCSFDPDDLKTVINVNGTEIAVFPDPVHMLKLIRNSFEHYKQFEDAEGNKIKWDHLVLLNKLQEDEQFHAANKLRAKHLLFKKNIMKVKLATQLFSRSVAIALRFCRDNLKLNEFQDVEGTATMLLNLNDLFDILDSKVHGYGFKRAINLENAPDILQRLEACKGHLLNLTTTINDKKTRLVQTTRYTGFVGFCACIESANFLFKDLVESHRCPYLSFHRISQDHIELFFCNVRSRGGANNNPTPKQFHGIYRKMLVHMELQDLNTGNCVALENISILNCSSAMKRINLTTARGDISETENDVEDDVLYSVEKIQFSQFSESIIQYISGAVVHYLTKNIKCNTCVRALVSCQEIKSSLIYARNVGGLTYPSDMVTKICKRCEQAIRSSINESQNKSILYKDKLRLATIVLRSFVSEHLFPELTSHQFDYEESNHVIDLAKSVIEKYIDIRLLYLSKKSDPHNAIRRIYTKLIHFKNQ